MMVIILWLGCMRVVLSVDELMLVLIMYVVIVRVVFVGWAGVWGLAVVWGC